MPVDWPASRTTIWVRIRDAQAGRTTAVNDILQRYREPIRRFFVVKGLGEHDAEDLTQEVLVTLVEGGVLDKADRSRGRFRNLLIAVAKNVMMRSARDGSRLKRGGGARAVAIEDVDRMISAPEADESFDREWVNHLLTLATGRLQREHREWFAVFDLYVNGDLSYAEVGARLGKSENTVDSHLRQAKARIAEFIREEIAAYASSASENEEEQVHLLRYLLNR